MKETKTISCPCGCGCRVFIEQKVVIGEAPCTKHDLPLGGALDHMDALNKHCYRCGYDWTADDESPATCARCRSRYWYIQQEGKIKPGRKSRPNGD